MSKTENHKPITEKLSDLEASVEWFYGDEFSLDQAIGKYQAAVNLSKEIEADLDELQNQVEVLADFTK